MPIIAFPDRCSFKLQGKRWALSRLGKGKGEAVIIFAAHNEDAMKEQNMK